ncbi:MAG: hypothetical protein WAO35_27315 [Terriglobia bacterium]
MELTLAAVAAAWNGAAYLLDRRGNHRLARMAQAAGVDNESAAVLNNTLWLTTH